MNKETGKVWDWMVSSQMTERTNAGDGLLPPAEKRRALFSQCEKYRYLLEIIWDDSKPLIQFIGLNPSTADEMKDDRTVAKLKRLAKRWGYGGLLMTNLFAFRATKPEEMKRQSGPLGLFNFEAIRAAARRAKVVVAAWGAHGEFLKMGEFLRNEAHGYGIALHYLRLTKNGHPEHPLYLPEENLEPKLWVRET